MKRRFLVWVVVLSMAISGCQLIPNFRVEAGRSMMAHYCDKLPGGYGCSWQLVVNGKIVLPR